MHADGTASVLKLNSVNAVKLKKRSGPYNSFDSSAIPDMVAKYFPSSQKTEEYRLTDGTACLLKLNSVNAVKLKNHLKPMSKYSYSL